LAVGILFGFIMEQQMNYEALYASCCLDKDLFL